MKIKTGDNVRVIAGRERGKSGKVLQVMNDAKRQQYLVVVEGLNLRKKHLRGRKGQDKGQVIELSAPIHISNVMVIDSKSNKPTRVGFRVEGTAKKRIAKRSNEFID